MKKHLPLAKLAGYALVILALGFIFQRFWNSWHILDWSIPNTALWVLIGGIIVYALSNFMLSFAWGELLQKCGENALNSQTCHGIYGRTQLNKYIPGNIFHFVGRHMLSRQFKCSHFALICALGYEIMLLAGVAGIIALPGVFLLTLSQETTWMYAIPIIGLAFIFLFLISLEYYSPALLEKHVSFLLKHLGHDQTLLAGKRLIPIRELWKVILAYWFYFNLNAVVFIALIYAFQSHITQQDIFLLLSGYAFAWLVGFVVPGAPAGLGLREVVLLAVVAPVWGEPLGLLVIGLFRLMTVAGDVLYFLFSFLIAPNLNPPEQINTH